MTDTSVDRSSLPPPAQKGFEHVRRAWDPALHCWMAKILPGEFFVTRHEEALSTVLGSCVAACMREPRSAC